MLTLIVARARDGAIGRRGQIPWHAPEDLAFFQRETLGGALIMGRHTWEGLPVRPLKNRLNIVVSSNGCDAPHVVGSVEAGLELARDHRHARIYGIGGAGIYRALIERAERLLITEVDTTVPDADTYFPDHDPSHWRGVGRILLREATPQCELREWLRL